MIGRTQAPKLALALIISIFVALAVAVATLTAPWEANDEPDHVRNVQSLVGGRMYRIEPASGIESHQAPLYYAVLAGWQQLLGIEPRLPTLVGSGLNSIGLFRHDVPSDGADQRMVTALRLPGVAFGAVTVLLTAATARLVSRDPWTPVVAAAMVAGVPKFVFVSGVVNNDSLAASLGASVTFGSLLLLLRPPRLTRDRVLAWGLIGACVGAAVLTKLTAASLILPAVVAAVAVARSRGTQAVLILAVVGGTLIVTAPWLAFNVLNYGDVLAINAQVTHLRRVQPGVFHEGNYLARLIDGPRFIWKSFWYMSGWNQFQWPAWAYLPFWGGTALALAGWLRPTHAEQPRGFPTPRSAWIVLGAAALAGVMSVMAVAVATAQAQGRLGFIGLSAIAVLVAVGLERWRAPLAVRFALPALGIGATVFAIRQDVVAIYLLP